MSDSRCSACNTLLIWAITPAGKRAPVTAATHENGNVLILQPRGLGQTLAITLSGGSLELARKHGLPLHLNHFADCPNREDFQTP
jgi:hypothetical protein